MREVEPGGRWRVRVYVLEIIAGDRVASAAITVLPK
jgi:hypothetical protein